ncbi:hypothetical protein L596_025065 [Steinernema carpocapsae]|uniref:Uncharacterized protein n=1 Tax=Steinernema carpocapsae TaxID=34508 RepID=A0A4U5M7J1_STECR|nr:hypothetical protein L596_025065 [Steinernema carpocapsae]
MNAVLEAFCVFGEFSRGSRFDFLENRRVLPSRTFRGKMRYTSQLRNSLKRYHDALFKQLEEKKKEPEVMKRKLDVRTPSYRVIITHF